MTPSVRVRSVPQGAYRAYLTKANECYIDMQNAVKAARWNSAAILAVHTVVSACDALTSFYLRIRCRKEIDWKYLEKRAEQHNVQPELTEIQAKLKLTK